MKKVFLIFLSLIFIFTFQVKAITLEDITSGKFQSKDIAEVYPSADGVHYFTATNGNTRIVKCEYRTGHEVDTLFDVKTARECNLEQFDGFSLSPDEKHLLIYADSEPIYRRSFKATYYTFEIRRNLLKPLSDGGKQQAAVYSPNGRMVAFVRDNNIFIKKLDYGTEVAVTRDGERNKIINGIPDWVYEEEFALTSTLQWSPDDATLAFVRFDESHVPEYSFSLYEGYCPTYPGIHPISGKIHLQISGSRRDQFTSIGTLLYRRNTSLKNDETAYIIRQLHTSNQIYDRSEQTRGCHAKPHTKRNGYILCQS